MLLRILGTLMASTSSSVHWKKYVSGYAASATNILCTYPFIKIGWRQIILDVNTTNATKKVLNESNRLMYRGVMPTMIHKSSNISIMYGIHSQVFGLSTRHSMTPLQANIIGGLTTGTIHTFIMPFERLQTILVNEKFDKVYKNSFDALLKIYKETGIKEFYRGFTVSYLRNVAAQSSFFVCKYKFDRRTEIIKIPVLRNLAYFFEGGLLSGLSYAFFYPLIALRVTMQKDIGGPFRTIRETAKEMYAKNKLRSFYRGVHVSIFRAFVGGGIVNSSYEFYMTSLNRIFD